MWLGPNTPPFSGAIIACENGLTVSSAPLVKNPSANLAVDSTPLFNGTSCIQDFPVCVDKGTECGNSCEIPYEKSCSQLATVFGLSYSRFSALNPALLCTADKEIALGTSVCMGGTCGD